MGGHYYSMRAIAEAYHAGNTRGDAVDLCTIGTCPSPVVEGSPLKHVHIAAGPGSFQSAWRAFSGLVRSGGYDVLHAYDLVAHGFTRFAAARHSKKLVLTRCGGPPPIYFPFSPAMVLFSRENLDAFRARRKFSSTRLHHIPNRVNRPSPSAPPAPADRQALGIPAGPLVLRIARIGSAYDAGSIALVAAVEALSREIPDLQLLLIGAVYDEGARRALVDTIESANGRLNRTAIQLRTEGEFTLNASRFLPLADFVVGTGRGAMEAMALGKPVYIALKNGAIVLINPSTAGELSDHNFSGRTSSPSPSFSGHTMGETLRGLAGDPAGYHSASGFSRSFFDAHLAIESALGRYEEMYADLSPRGRFPWTIDALANVYFVRQKFSRTGP